MIKSYDEMRKIDVQPYCEDRDGFSYLNWAKCIDLLHQNGAQKVYWYPVVDEKTGSSLRMVETEFKDTKGNTNRCYETRIHVVIDDIEEEFQAPVMNGVNPVKDNSTSQLRVWNSMCRSFVKAVAILTGLGFDLWLKEETGGSMKLGFKPEEAKPDEASLKALKDMCKKNKVDLDYWITSNGKTLDTLTALEVGTMLRTLNDRYGD